MRISHVTELLSPAGSLKNMRYAFAYGADAVYAGQPRYSLRVRNNEFDHDHLAIGIQEAHELHLRAQHQVDQPVLLQRNDEDPFAAEEDEHGTYFMNSKDLRAVQHVERLTYMGIHSLKIEGRTKSYFYCARTAQIYRKAIDDALAGRPFDPALMTQLEGLANRGYTEGFLRRHVHSEYQNYENGSSSFEHQQYCGEILQRHGDYLKVDVKNRFVVGDVLELMTTSGNITFKLTEILDKKGNVILEAKGSGHVVDIPVPADVDMRYALLIRHLPQSSTDISASALAYVAS